MLQNRVDPFGNVIITNARGTLMGNRGIIHDRNNRIVRPFQSRAWITCALSYKDQRLPIMEPHHNTQLFFLDEAVSFSAGHRPCAFCRRADFNRFKRYWREANSEYGFDTNVPIASIDAILHRERIDSRHLKIRYTEITEDLPGGVFVVVDEWPHLLAGGFLFAWTPSGYNEGVKVKEKTLAVLTPRSVVKTFKAGYVPGMKVSI